MNKQALILLLGCWMWSHSLFSQVDTVSGIINAYAHVSSLNTASNLMTVDDASAFSADDRVLLIQMRGGSISTLNNNSFGDVLSLNGAGSYMFAKVCNVSSATNEITLQETIDPNFATANFDSAGIQLVRIPFFPGDLFVNGVLTAQPWNGQKGGILVFEVNGKLILGADIDVDGMGFRGGVPTSPGGNCLTFVSLSGQSYSWASQNGGGKGEGIAAFIPGEETGKGPLANGGGGGNNHNAGGAGGGNYGSGGVGGLRNTGTFSCYGNDPGRAGNSLSGFGYSLANPRLFLGGGGGAGHSNNAGNGMPGGNGGGLVFITADEIEGNGYTISARGEDAANSGSDGGSGGGAGGSIILEANTLTAPFALNVKGGDGGDTGISQCQGPGGGGGGGVIWSSVITPVGISLNGNGGQPGVATIGGCGGNQGAASGNGGVVSSGYVRPASPSVACVLPAYWVGVEASIQSGGILLSGKLSSADASVYQLQVRRDVGKGWETIALIQARANGLDELLPQYLDGQPILGKQSYQMVLIDVDGKEIPSELVEAHWEVGKGFVWKALGWKEDGLEVWVENPDHAGITWELYSLDGKLIWKKKSMQEAYKGRQVLDVGTLGRGAYLLRAMRNGSLTYQKIMK